MGERDPHTLQEEYAAAETSSEPSPLGLTLTKTPSFLNLLQNNLSRGKQPRSTTMRIDDDSRSQSIPEKLKASNFPAVVIKIGSWQRISLHEGDLVAKLYYAKRKLVWEVLERALKSKIEIQWSDIAAIRAATNEHEPGTLEIELSRPPLFYRESNPQPRKHTLWQQTSDFTGGQASIWRRHYARFPPGMLDKHYAKLLQCDQRLATLAMKPFSSGESPYFDCNAARVPQNVLAFAEYNPGYSQQAPYPYQMTYPYTTAMSDVDSMLGNEGRVLHSQVADQEGIMNWGMNNVSNINQGQSQIPYQQNVGLLNDLLMDSRAPDGVMNATMRPIYSMQEASTHVISPNYNSYPYDDQVRLNNPMSVQGSQYVNWFEPQAGSVMRRTLDDSSGSGIPDNLG